jgi:hypothetical protein
VIGKEQRQARSPRTRLIPTLTLVALVVGTTGYSSCAGSMGPLLVPITVTPGQVLLRAPAGSPAPAVALARVDGGEESDRYVATVAYGKNASDWLEVTVSRRELTLRASAEAIA